MKDDLDQIVTLSIRINEQAKMGEWESLEQLQAQRAQLLAKFSQRANGELANESDQVRKAIEQIKSLDAESLTLIRTNQKKLSEEHQKHSKGQKMKKAYSAF